MIVSLPEGYAFRPARLADGPAVLAMLNEETEALIGVPLADIDWVTSPWTAPGADGHVYTVVEDAAGAVVGYLLAECRPPYTEVFSLGVVALSHHGRGIGAAIVEEIERRGRELARRAPPGERVVVQVGALADEPRVSALLSGRGYAEVRRFWLMRIEFSTPPAPPGPIEGVEIRTLERGQEGEVFRCLDDAFRDHWGWEDSTEEDWIHLHVDVAEFDPTWWLLAWAGDRLAGVLVSRPASVQEPAFGYVNELGVRREHRRRGIGEALLRTCFRRLHEHGSRGALLHVDSQSITGAERLYERAGMTATPQFSRWEKELVPARA
jgi:mycothiol synthase